jgi:hypothetical protein
MAMAYGGKHQPMEFVLLEIDYTTDLTSVPAGAQRLAGLSLSPL